MRPLFALPLFLFIAACADVPEPEADIVAEPIVPLAGMWAVDSRGILKDECGGILGEEPDPEAEKDTFELTMNDDGTFTMQILFDDGESYDIDCERQDTTFTCNGARDLYDISGTVLSLTWSGGGEFYSDTELTAILDATAYCDGALCPVAESYLGAELPCDGTMTMNASFEAEL